MKKVIILFVLMASSVSFANNSVCFESNKPMDGFHLEDNINSANKTYDFKIITGSCTATVTYMGSYVTHFTVSAIGGMMGHACSLARQLAEEYIRQQTVEALVIRPERILRDEDFGDSDGPLFP
uniref:hypothetical protein n=1 Tax=Mariniflexile sp. TaxID=1979402 RepID=UPI00404751D8